MIFTIGVCAAAAFLFGRGIYHSGVLAGWITMGLRQEMGRTPPPRAPSRPLVAELPDYSKEDEREARLFLDNPFAWWLDPNRWGDNPDWLEKLGRVVIPVKIEPVERPQRPAPPCPICPDGGKRTVMAIHDGEATMWDCFVCGCEFTRAGETKTSKKQRHAKYGNYTVLPCGHTGDVLRGRAPYTGWWWTRCETCKAEWEPRSDDPTGRSLGQGESVWYPDDPGKSPAVLSHEAERNRAWEKRANAVNAGKAENHGSCPGECGMPVDKRGGMYYCSDQKCHRYSKGWK